ncbi:5-fold beta-flower protein [Dyadobacter flavalbus]|uniref:5-fold beta-flower protein n=1 Tax=Dyadobacter flavalbus TaxID=2579942 RepID=UPI00286E31E4|nr:heavy metal-binding domain-containing protein [Dyadobacter flavalbus]
MKTIHVKNILLLIILMIPTVLFAQANYKQPFNIAKDGMITDAAGTTIGSVTKENIVKDHKGHKIAFVDGEGSLIDAHTNKKMGRMGKDGKTYYNANGEIYLTVKDKGETCEIYDASGKKIGDVHSSYKGMACGLHCFENGLDANMQKKPVSATAYVCPMHPEITGKEGDSCSKCHMKLVKK